MSWLSEFFGGGGGGAAPTVTVVNPASWSEADWNSFRQSPLLYEPVKHLDPKFQREQQAAEDAQRQAQLAAVQGQIAAAQGVGTTQPGAQPSGPSAEELAAQEQAFRQEALGRVGTTFPGGFEQGLVPGTLDDPFIEQIYGRERGKADELLSRMLKRGTLTESGRARGVRALEGQAPRVRTQLTDIGNLLLEQERGGLRNIANEARTAAGGLTLGQAFDPETYMGRARQRASEFGSNFGTAYGAAVPAGDLFDVSGLGSAAGAVQGPQNVSFDPYAVEGGQLRTGLEEEEGLPVSRRRGSVF